MQQYAIVCPGQGSQFVGMLSDLADQYSSVKATFQQAADILGLDLWQVAQQGPETLINQTEITQPLMLVAGIVVYDLLQKQILHKPAFVAGHSLGEYTALVIAEVLSFTDAVRVVAKRAELMIQAMQGQKGSMAAIVGLTDEQVQILCDEASQGELITPANYNSIGQVVIAGHQTAVQRAIAIAETMDARLAKEIPVSVPCHCPLMQPAADIFADFLATIDFKAPTITFIQNVDAQSQADPIRIKQALVQQLYMPVQWVKTIQTIAAAKCQTIIECGPGKVLTGLNKRIDRGLNCVAINDAESLSAISAKHD